MAVTMTMAENDNGNDNDNDNDNDNGNGWKWQWLRNETYKPQNSRNQALSRHRFLFAPPLCRFHPIREPGDEARVCMIQEL